MAINDSNKTSRLFKKLFGKAETNVNWAYFEEGKSGRNGVFTNQIWSDSPQITNTAPTLSNGQISGVTQYYQDLSLTLVAGTTGGYYHSAFTNAIPSNFGDGSSYNIIVKDADGTSMPGGNGDWAIDTEAGVLMFYTTPTGTMPPKVSFYKYVGNFGIGAATDTYTKAESNANFLSASTTMPFLALTGGTLTGDLNVSGYNVTASTFYGNIDHSYIQNVPATVFGTDLQVTFNNNDVMSGNSNLTFNSGSNTLFVYDLSATTAVIGNIYNKTQVDNIITGVTDTVNVVTKYYNGFLNRTDTTISFNNTTKTFTITGNTGSFWYFRNSQKVYKTIDSIVLTNTGVTGGRFIYYDQSDVLVQATSDWNLFVDVPVAYVYWDAEKAVGILVEERHGLSMDAATHTELHSAIGTYTVSGFAIADYTLNTFDDNSTRFTISSGIVANEDIRHTTEILSSAGTYFILHRTGSTTAWTWDEQNFPFLYNGSNEPLYNQNSGGTWLLTPMTDGDYINMYMFVSTAIDGTKQYPIIVGETTYSNEANAVAAGFGDLTLIGLPFQEFASLYKFTYQYSASTVNTGRVQLVNAVRVFADRVVIQANNLVYNNHSALSNLNGDDHLQYALLTGRVGDILKIDSIVEYTVNNGINIEGVILKDNSLTASTISASTINASTINASTFYGNLDYSYLLNVPLTSLNYFYIPTATTHTIISDVQNIVYGDYSVIGDLEIKDNAKLTIINGNLKQTGLTSVSGTGQIELVNLLTVESFNSAMTNYYSISGGTLYGDMNANGYSITATTAYIQNLYGFSPINVYDNLRLQTNNFISFNSGDTVKIGWNGSYLKISGASVSIDSGSYLYFNGTNASIGLYYDGTNININNNLQYNQDYSALYTTYSLVDKNYVDKLTLNATATTTAVANTQILYSANGTITGNTNLFFDYNNNILVVPNMNIIGNLYVSGTTTYVNTTDMNIADNFITINSGETGTGVTKMYAGIRIDRGTASAYTFLFDESQDNFRIGFSDAPTGGTQAIATRQDTPISNGVSVWNSINYRFDTFSELTYDSVSYTLITNVLSASTLIGYLDYSYLTNAGINTQVIYNNGGTLSGDSTFTFNNITSTLTIPNINTTSIHITSTGITTTASDLFLTTETSGSVAIVGDVTHLRPSTNGLQDLGNASYNWRTLYASNVSATTICAITFEYFNDNSSNYTNRSLVDKGYVDSSIISSTATTTSVANTQILYSSGGTITGNSGLTFDGTKLNTPIININVPGEGVTMTTPDGLNKYKITLDNSGNLVSTLIP